MGKSLIFPMEAVMAHVHTAARPRVERLSKAVLLALAVAVVMVVVSGAGLGEGAADGARLGGDYPAFHGAGSIVADGDIEITTPNGYVIPQ